MRRPFIAGNWKLNHGPAVARDTAKVLGPLLAQRGDVVVAVFPPALSIPVVVETLKGTGIDVGIQEVHDQDAGAFTGANSAAMAREAGCAYALVGHSERRQLFGETDEGTRRKVATALRAGLLPILCVGETLQERRAGRVEDVIFRQLGAALSGLEPDQVSTLTLAYEPVWAIGTGETATPGQAQAVHAVLRQWLGEHYPPYVAESVRIQYGGSVKPDNASELMACPDIDGLLVGGASLKADSFAAIVRAASAG